jgi:predicted 2-oxoglutarate/Fe(II)-dependent dioxygenase YbiX
MKNNVKNLQLKDFVHINKGLIPGDVVVFPSLFLFPHRIEEVTENMRYSGVAWGC